VIPLLGLQRVPESDISDHHKNIAFAVQEACERADDGGRGGLALQKTRFRANLCLAAEWR